MYLPEITDDREVFEEESLFGWALIRLVVKPARDVFGIPVATK